MLIVSQLPDFIAYLQNKTPMDNSQMMISFPKAPLVGLNSSSTGLKEILLLHST